ncbi:MAG TPA: COX15/CtaA family protein [Bryobacteraceae bacterium]|nr:COX15/CtaA family protein [Bryobacteraceae bacterium]
MAKTGIGAGPAAGSRPASLGAGVRHIGFGRYSWFVLTYNVAVVLWGAYVRATGSGAGCGNHWPLCNGEVTPTSASVKTLIEFTHRAMTGLDVPLVALLVFWAYRAFPRRHPVRLSATLSAVFLVTEALIGAALVKLEHVARNADAYSLSTHLVNTLTLLACLTLTAWWGTGNPMVRVRGREAWLAAVSLAAMMLLSVTGAISALGDTLFPAATLGAGLAQDFDPASSILLRLRGLHPLIAAGVGTWLMCYAVAKLRDAKAAALWVIAGVWLQLLAGLVNLLLLAPVWMQLAHLLLADLLWISLVVLCAAGTRDSAPRRPGAEEHNG